MKKLITLFSILLVTINLSACGFVTKAQQKKL